MNKIKNMYIRKRFHQSLIYFFILNLVNLNDARTQCSSNYWTCDNGQCIRAEQLCDIRVDCRDGSDESEMNCLEFDELNNKYIMPTRLTRCIFPNIPALEKMIIKYADTNEVIKLGSAITDGDVYIECKKPYILRGLPQMTCTDGVWNYDFPICVGRSDSAPSTSGPTITSPFHPGTTLAFLQEPTLAPVKVNRCIIPNIEKLQNMIFRKHPQNETIELGSSVENFESINIECMNRYILRGQTSLLCRDGMWNTDFPICVGHCDGSILQGVSIQTICRYRSQYHKCQKDINPGTEIEIICAHGYKRIPNEKQHLKCFGNSSFNEIPMRCKQNCGRITSDAESLSRNGISIEPIMAPWHVSIFELVNTDYVYICSGSIVSPRIVITAAHCFWDEANLKIQMFTNFVIKAGSSTKIYSLHDGKSQIVQVNQIHIPERYRGRDNNQRDDIAFLKLNTTLIYTENIAPICIPDEILNTASSYVLSHQEGFITGFDINNQLERLKMLTLSHHDCRNKSPSDIHLANDKFCIYNNERSLVCRGDSGAGFVVKDTNLYDYEDKYRLLGVVSNTPTTKNDCTPEGEYVAVTNIFYMPWEFSRRLAIAIKEDEALF